MGRGSNPSLEAQIPASRPKSQPRGSNSSLELQNLLSIGHRLLRGRCPSHHHTPTYTHIAATGTADHLTLLRLFLFILFFSSSFCFCLSSIHLPTLSPDAPLQM